MTHREQQNEQQTPQLRLASLVCSNTDLLAALGLTDQLVAVDSYSDAPCPADAVCLGPDLNIDIDRLVSSRPDLVLASLSVPGMDKILEQVEANALPVLVFDPLSVSDVVQNMIQLGQVLGVAPHAREVAAQFQADLSALENSCAHHARPPRVVVEWWPKPIIVATQESWVTDLLASLGAVNAFAERAGRSSPVTLEEVRAAQPDLIVCSWCGSKNLRPEVIEARGLGVPVLAVPESGLGRPGPRLVEGARAIAQTLKALKHLEL